MNTLRTIWTGLDWSVLLNMLLSILPALVCITLHELAHGLVAYRLGDRTAKDAGRLTLNPIRHIDISGLIMMIVFKFGWAKPVPVDMRNFKNPKAGMAICAAAGPLCNLLLALVFLLLYGFFYLPLMRSGAAAGYTLAQLLLSSAYLSLALAVFNLIPISPLDGSKVLFSFLPEETYWKLMRYERYGMIVLILLMLTDVLNNPLSAATGWLLDHLFIFAEWGFALGGKIF